MDAPTSKATLDVIAERQRQINGEGFDANQDDDYAQSELLRAALWNVARAIHWPFMFSLKFVFDGGRWSYPWPKERFKPHGKRRLLVIAAALIIAHLDSMDRKGEDQERIANG